MESGNRFSMTKQCLSGPAWLRVGRGKEDSGEVCVSQALEWALFGKLFCKVQVANIFTLTDHIQFCGKFFFCGRWATDGRSLQ